MTFKELNLSAPLLHAVQEAGYETPSPIQAAAIPPVLAGRDLMGCAQTGTGKTAAFALPILQRLSRTQPAEKGIRALILTPTRELALQIGDELQPAVHVSSLILYNLPVGEGGFLLPRLKVYLKKENSWNLLFCSVWNETRARHVTKLQPSFVIPVGRSSPVLGRLDRTCAGTFSLCSLTTSSPCSTFPSAPCCCRGD